MTSFPSTPAEHAWVAKSGGLATLSERAAKHAHPMSYTSIKVTIGAPWVRMGETHVIARLTVILAGESSGAPFGPRDTGYRWQLDSSNDWWAQLDGDTLTLAYRYGNRDCRKLRALAEWAAVVFQGRVQHPVILSCLLARQGGRWVGAARSWMQTRFKNGERVTWGSNDLLEGHALTVADVEEVASRAAAEALNERNEGRI